VAEQFREALEPEFVFDILALLIRTRVTSALARAIETSQFIGAISGWI
jgi:hypothetical protein